MKTLATVLVLSSLFFISPAMAGGGHNHGHSHAQAPVNQATAEKNAQEVILSLVKKNKVAKSWASITASSVKKKVFNNRYEWVVVFVNDKVTDTEKQKLHVFLTLEGEYIAVNHTGN